MSKFYHFLQFFIFTRNWDSQKRGNFNGATCFAFTPHWTNQARISDRSNPDRSGSVDQPFTRVFVRIDLRKFDARRDRSDRQHLRRRSWRSIRRKHHQFLKKLRICDVHC